MVLPCRYRQDRIISRHRIRGRVRIQGISSSSRDGGKDRGSRVEDVDGGDFVSGAAPLTDVC